MKWGCGVPDSSDAPLISGRKRQTKLLSLREVRRGVSRMYLAYIRAAERAPAIFLRPGGNSWGEGFSRWFIAAALLLAIPVFGQTSTLSGVESLQRFFTEVNRYTARFTQVLLDEEGKPVQESSGRLWIERPNKFRWDYETPYKQQIVSDGERLWVYDEDLRQVTVRLLKDGLLETPAALLAGKGRPEEQFHVKDAGAENNLAWVALTPKRRDTGVEEVRLGFGRGRLQAFEIVDGLGQTTRYALQAGVENQPIDPARFKFTPPPGADVVGAP